MAGKPETQAKNNKQNTRNHFEFFVYGPPEAPDPAGGVWGLQEPIRAKYTKNSNRFRDIVWGFWSAL